jgi:hypothetical protein
VPARHRTGCEDWNRRLTGKTPEYISEEEMAYMATHGDAVMYPTLVKKTG